MLAKDLIDRLERLGLLDQEIIEALREQLAQSGARVTPEAVAKLLVDNGQLTRFQATKLIGELRDGEYSDPDEAAGVVAGQASDELGLIDSDDSVADAIEVVEATEVSDEAVVVNEASMQRSGYGSAVAEAIPDDGQMGSGGSRTRKVNTGKKVVDPTKSVWDSFKIYGVAATILVLAFFGSILYFIMSKGSADEFIKAANEQYSKQIYDGAKLSYTAFLEQFGEANPHSSIARTRRAMSELYLFAEFSDPARATNEAEKILPRIENEPGLEEERGNLAALLVDVADNIAKAAGEAKDTKEKQRLLADLERQIKLTENPAYVTSSARTALAGRLLGVNETRARVQRDINRNLRLDESVASMETDLKEQETKEAYDTRVELLREFPELRGDQRLETLVVSASNIQQQLVKPAAEKPTVSTEPLPIDSVKSISLTNRSGEAAPGLTDEVVYIRVHGAILALSAAEGKQLWRRYVGYGQNHTPVPINPGGQDGVLLSDSQSLEVQRAESTDGAILWRTQIGEPFSQPMAYDRDIYLSTESGRVMAIEADQGEARWVTQIPQPLEESPGINLPVGKLYLTGDHSNLYVLDKRTGQCNESFYIGHAKGTCAVPPITLQGKDSGHVFVIENAGVDYALMHVLKCDQEGKGLRVAQAPFRLVGNVTVSPVLVLGRRLIVSTDRGQVAVFDIEQSIQTGDQVSKVAEQVASYDTPTSSHMAVGKNQMWVTGMRIRRFELQVSTGRVVPDWSFNEGDAFIGAPVLIDDTLIHARVLKGTSGVRVTAADPRSGKPFWQTDVGVPVSLLTTNPDGKGLFAVTSQAALFALDAQALADGATSGPIENPGGSGASMRFENPLWIDKDRAVMINQESRGQICVYDPTRANQKLRLITLAFSAGNSVGQGVIAGDGLLVPLDSGRIVLMNWQTGTSLGSPFQPPSAPGTTVRWTDCVLLGSDANQVVIADDRKKMYRLRVAEQIRELASVDMKEPLLGPMAAIGDTIVASIAGPASDVVLCFKGASLEETAREQLDGRIVWGPFAAGEMVLIQTDDGMLRGIDAAGQSKMTPVQLPQGQPLPGLKTLGDNLMLTGRNGWLAVIEKATGKLVGLSDLKQPLSAQPLEVGKRLLVPGTEGLVYITTVPDSVAAE